MLQSHIIIPALNQLPPPFILLERSVSPSDLKSWKPYSCSAESGIDPHSHVSVKHKTEGEEKFFFPTSSCGSSSLLHREGMLKRNIPSNGVQSLCCMRHTGAVVHFPHLQHFIAWTKVRAPLTRISNSMEEVRKVGNISALCHIDN